jgi:hypothetical protein
MRCDRDSVAHGQTVCDARPTAPVEPGDGTMSEAHGVAALANSAVVDVVVNTEAVQ